MKIKVKKLHPSAILPVYSSEDAACFDLATYENKTVDDDAVVFKTGLAFEIPKGFAMMIYSRSGHGFKHGIRLSNCVGVIDSDYRGEVQVRLVADDFLSSLEIKAGDRIAQAMLVPVNKSEFEEVQELSETQRGENGFGSTGS